MLDTAVDLTQQGFFVVPVPFMKKKTCMKDWTKCRLSLVDLPKHFGNASNIGLLLGIAPHFVVDVDLDCNEAVVAARLIPGPETQRISGRAGKRSSHYFFSLPHETKTRKFAAPQGEMVLEIRGVGHQTIIPPSVHPSGENSEWERDGSFEKSTEAEVVNWGARVASAALLARHWPEKGRRHEGVLALSGILGRSGWIPDAAIEFIHAAALIAGDEEWREREGDVRSTFAKLQRDEATTGAPRANELFGQDIIRRVGMWLELEHSPLQSHRGNIAFSRCTDAMNANRFAERHADSLRYCSKQKIWYAWTGTRWRGNEQGEAIRRAGETARSIYGEAQREEDDVKRQQLAKWAIQSESRQRLEAMVALARFTLDIEVHSYSETFDRDPWLLNCENGIVDLRTGVLGPHRRNALITRIAPIKYDPNAGCLRWNTFLDDVTCGNSDLALYLQRVAGYVLTGDTREHAFFLLHGEGSNGKTTFVNVIANLLGDYAHAIPFQEFIEKTHEGGSNEIAQLEGTRFVYSMEAPVGRAFNEALLKQLSGGDKIRARALYQESVEWDTQAKLFFSTNHRPEIRETADAIWNRVQLLPFRAVFLGQTCDKELSTKLHAELAGILSWAVRGCLSWQCEGLNPPAEVIAANRDYRAENDTFSDFLRERGVIDSRAHCLSRDLYGAYLKWAHQNGLRHVMTKRAVGNELGRRGYIRSAYNGRDAWRGIGLAASQVG